MGGFAQDQTLKTIIEDSQISGALGVSDMSIDQQQRIPKDIYDVRAQYNSAKKERRTKGERG